MFQRKDGKSKPRIRSIVKRGRSTVHGFRSRLQLEELEQRQLLSVAPAGPEFQVKPFATGTAVAAVASDAAGDFVVAWSSNEQDPNGDVYVQRYNAAGVAQGSFFLIDEGAHASVAMDSSGDFVVAWSGRAVHAQRYNAAGVAQGSQFQVNTFVNDRQNAPSVAMDSTGDFVVAWQSFLQDGSRYGVYAQRYDAAGVALGSEFRVNTYTANYQYAPSVAMDSAGDFVVAWDSYGQDGSQQGIYAQRYNAAGVAQGSEFLVNIYTTSQQGSPSEAMDSAGDFVVSWQSYGQDGSNYGIYAQRYNAAGVAQGSEFRVNTYTTNSQLAPRVAIGSAGDFVVAWESNGEDGSNYGVYAQRYNAAGVAHGCEFRINTFTTNDQKFPSVAMDSAGDFVVAWGSSGQDGSGYGIYAQRYAVTPSSVVGRDMFYANSPGYDLPGGSNPQTPLPFSDDNGIASDKPAYLPGSGAATMANVSSYDRGINGIMFDLDNTGSHTSITLANILNDFTFKVGNNNSPGSWVAAPLPISVLVRSCAGVVGSDRIELIWADNAIQEQWIEVIVKATTNTGLAANDVFFFGNEIGATGASNTATIAKVSAADVTDTQTHGATLKANIPVTNVYDFNKDGQVGSADVTDAQTHGTTNKTGLNFINIGAGGPFAPDAAAIPTPAAGSESSVASALASTSTSARLSPATVAWIANRLGRLDSNRIDLNSGPITKYFEHLAQENPATSPATLVNADEVADALNLDDALVDSLLAELGLPD